MEICCISVRFPVFPAIQHRSSCSKSPMLPSLSLKSWSEAGSRKPGIESGDKGRMFVFGMGFVSCYVADQLMRQEGWNVSGTCTSAIKKKKLEEMGYNTFIFNTNEIKLEGLNTLQFATHLLVSIPPIAGLGDPLLSLREDLQNMLSYGNLQWICYLSSTSVYGDCGGALVDEDYPANPMSKSAKARLIAEQGWLDLGNDLGVSVNVFRLGGVYGPGRSALDTIMKEKPLSKYQRMREFRRYTARVHVADIYQAIKASFNVAPSGRVYNIVDDDPAPRAEVFAFASNLIKEKWPGQIKEVMSFDSDNSVVIQEENMKGEKRVSNARLKNELGVSLTHPSFRSGLQSISKSCVINPLQ